MFYKWETFCIIDNFKGGGNEKYSILFLHLERKFELFG